MNLHPYCNTCGWRKGGRDSWNGVACKCGHTANPMQPLTADELGQAPMRKGDDDKARHA